MNTLRSAGSMSLGTLVSRVMGLVREQVFAVFFGAGSASDAFQIAFRIPNLLRDLFAEGAMSSSFVPSFIRTRESEGSERAWQVAGRVFRILFFLTLLLSLVGIYYSENLVGLYAGAFRQVPGKFELTVTLTQIMFLFFPFVALAAAYMGVLNASKVYFLPAFASALFNLVSIVVGLATMGFFAKAGKNPILGMAVGVVVGGLVQAFCQLPSIYRVGYRWKKGGPSIRKWTQDPALRQILFLLLPGTVGLAATQVTILVNSILATSQGTGAVSWLNYSFRLMQFPIGIFGVSLASATLPVFSKAWFTGKKDEAESELLGAIRSTWAINLPAAAGMAAISAPLIQLLFEYGRFHPQDTTATAMALAAYCLGLPFYSLVKVLVPVCYALQQTRIAVMASLGSVAVHVGLNLLLVRWMGFWGLGIGTSIAAGVQSLVLFYFIRRRLSKEGPTYLVWWSFFRDFLKHALIAAVMGGVCWFTAQGLLGVGPEFPDAAWIRVFWRSLRVFFLVAEGVLVVYLIAQLFHIEETLDFFKLLRRNQKAGKA